MKEQCRCKLASKGYIQHSKLIGDGSNKYEFSMHELYKFQWYQYGWLPIFEKD